MSSNKSKIRRHVSINGNLIWITAWSEQEYCDKIIELSRSSPEENKSSLHLFKPYAENWFNTFSAPNVTEVTKITYRRQLDLHIYPVVGNKYVEEITSEDVQTIFNSMGKDLKQDTKNKTKIVLNQILKLAVEDKLLASNPLNSMSVKIKGQTASVSKPYSVEQMQQFSEALPHITNRYDKAWLALAIALPLRCEEILGLRWQDVAVDGTISITSTVTHPSRNEPVFRLFTKTASSRRNLKLATSYLANLGDREDDGMFVVGGNSPISYTQLQRMLRRLQKETGSTEKITPRRFRTTVATDISAQTHDLKLVQQMLGHSTPQMTLKHYDKGRGTTADAIDAISKCYKL